MERTDAHKTLQEALDRYKNDATADHWSGILAAMDNLETVIESEKDEAGNEQTTKEHFQYFQKRFLYWADFLGEHGWKFAFFHLDTGNCFARIASFPDSRTARIEFCKEWAAGRPLTSDSIDETALHEAIHLLCSTLQWIGGCRYINDAELTTATEELVRRIQEVLERCIE